ncbi:MAG: hypothetical protein IJ565_00335 [Bacilli bacterium]|nr:hypothetical protein [Bacilli bacterium]
MNYYVREGNVISKYNVIYDKVILKRLKREVIDNCSVIKKHEETTNYITDIVDGSYEIRNMTKKAIGEKEYYEETRTVYHITYDKYIYPRLVYIIDRLLKNDLSVLSELYAGTEDDANKILNDQIQLISDELDNIDNKDVYKKKQKLDELEHLLENVELNKNQKPIAPYYELLKSMINMTKVGEMPVETIDEVNEFFDSKPNKILAFTRKKNTK